MGSSCVLIQMGDNMRAYDGIWVKTRIGTCLTLRWAKLMTFQSLWRASAFRRVDEWGPGHCREVYSACKWELEDVGVFLRTCSRCSFYKDGRPLHPLYLPRCRGCHSGLTVWMTLWKLSEQMDRGKLGELSGPFCVAQCGSEDSIPGPLRFALDIVGRVELWMEGRGRFLKRSLKVLILPGKTDISVCHLGPLDIVLLLLLEVIL